MQIRTASLADADRLQDIDGTIESSALLHVERSGEGLAAAWRIEQRAARQKLIEPNPMPDDRMFAFRQIVSGGDEGLALVAEHEGQVLACIVAQPDALRGVLRILDLRVDYDYRRQGLGSALIYHCIQEAGDRKLRAVRIRTSSNNAPAGQFLLHSGFELAGLDLHFHSNHDLVKDAVTLFWYAPLD